jgi:hypothetical protein
MMAKMKKLHPTSSLSRSPTVSPEILEHEICLSEAMISVSPEVASDYQTVYGRSFFFH